jgi:glycosyltransferase involved in cell wall biosynthesis
VVLIITGSFNYHALVEPGLTLGGTGRSMFSVVIPVFNHKNYIEEAIESALKSRLVSEVLIVDDGSTDGTSELLHDVARGFGPIVRILGNCRQENLGAHYRLNQLCREAVGPWIAVLNSDDRFVGGRFEIARDIARITKADFITGSLLIINEASRVIGTKRGLMELEYPFPLTLKTLSVAHQPDLLAALGSQNYVATTSNMIFTKDLFNKLRGFRDLRYTHDWDFALRACLNGSVTFSPHPLTEYRVHTANTIKEVSCHADGEVVRLFAWLLDEHHWIDRDPTMVTALNGNVHLSGLVRDRDIGRRDLEAESLVSVWTAKCPGPTGEPGSCLGSQLTDLSETGMSGTRAAANIALCLSQQEYDFVVLSGTLQRLPAVSISAERSNVFSRYSIHLSALTGDETLRGRIVRHVPPVHNRSPEASQKCDLHETIACCRDGADIIVGEGQARPFGRKVAAPLTLPGMPPISGRPRCLVFPVFMAVGGVERNLIENIRVLRDKYDFVVVTSEYLFEHQKSLHHQLDELGVLCLDLAEVANVERHIVLLESIKQTFEPDIVYICNGSPWLASSAKHLRRVFSRAAIVDQQVYDTRHGWIQNYTMSGIQSFERFIATNTRIKRKFISEFGMPRNRVDLIYPCINAVALSEGVISASAQLELRRSAGYADDQRVFGFMGRLTAQKRPLDFLDLARRCLAAGGSDEFILAGTGELAAECETYVKSNGLTNVRIVSGYSDVCEVANLIDGLIILSEFEGLPVVLLEALALGRPFLSTDVGDIALLSNEFKAGLIIQRIGDLSMNWEYFRKFANALGDLTKAAKECRGEILSRFSAETTAKAYDICWETAISQVPSNRFGEGRRR